VIQQQVLNDLPALAVGNRCVAFPGKTMIAANVGNLRMAALQFLPDTSRTIGFAQSPDGIDYGNPIISCEPYRVLLQLEYSAFFHPATVTLNGGLSGFRYLMKPIFTGCPIGHR
jgi:hypothetical protein